MKSSRSTRPDVLLRRDAEAELKHTPRAELPARSADELLHELQVHQIELKIQNEALRGAQVALEESRDRYVDLYEFAPVAYITLSVTGRVETINLTGAALLGIKRESFLHNRFTRFVASEDRDRWQRHFLYTLLHGGRSICELSIQRSDGTVFDASVDCLLAAESGSALTVRVTLTDITVYKQAVAKLRSSESRYSSIFENMPDGLAHCRMIFREELPVDYEFIDANPAFEKVSGLKDVVGRKISEIIPGYARNNPISLDILARVVRTGEPARWEDYLAAVDQWLLFAAYRPAPGEFVAVIENTSERKRAEDELRKLSLVVTQSPVSIVITDLDGRIEYVNPAFSLASGYSAAEALGQNPRVLKSDRTPPETYVDLWTTITAGKVWHGEFINRRKDGTEYLEVATISPVRQPDGTVTHYLAVKEDITELKRAMAELRLSEERLRLAKNAAGLGIFDWDIVNGKGEWDARARELQGIGPDEPLTLATLVEGIPPDERQRMQADFDGALDPRGTGEYRAETQVISRIDGSVRQLAANGQVLFEGGRPIRLVGTVKDVTKQRRLEKEIKERRKAMEGLVNQQVAAHTAAAIAHELNQPLVAVSAYSEAALRMLQGGAKSPEKLSRALEGAMKQAQRAGRMLLDLLDFLHKGETVAEPVELQRVVREALAIAEDSASGEFRHVIDLEPGLPPVLVNRLQLQKVLVNLLDNGVESMRNAGVADAVIAIKIRTMIEKDSNGQKMLQVTVQDCGAGLDAETAHRVFDPFFTTKPDGVGLGLAISRALIESHGGRLWADIKAGPGATFHFILPVAS